MGYAKVKQDIFDHHELRMNFDEIVITENGCEIIIACNALWAGIIVSMDAYDNSEVIIDGLYLINEPDEYKPLYKQAELLQYNEQTAYLFSAVQSQIDKDHEKIVVKALEARQS